MLWASLVSLLEDLIRAPRKCTHTHTCLLYLLLFSALLCANEQVAMAASWLMNAPPQGTAALSHGTASTLQHSIPPGCWHIGLPLFLDKQVPGNRGVPPSRTEVGTKTPLL